MQLKKLIKALQEFNGDLEVCVYGKEESGCVSLHDITIDDDTFDKTIVLESKRVKK